MLKKMFPVWAANREAAKYNLKMMEKVNQLVESTPEFAQDSDEGEWNALGEAKSAYSETELETLRDSARRLCNIDPGAKGLLVSLERFIIGSNAKVMCNDEKSQAYWDEWVKKTKFNGRMKELLRRLLRDGEFFMRFFPTTKELRLDDEGKLIQYMETRFVDPEEITDRSNTHTYGIETDPDDVENVINYHRTYVADGVEYSEVIPAKEILHGKINADSNEKRGKSFFLGIAKYLTYYRRWLDDRIRLNKIRSIFNLVIKPDSQIGLSGIQSKFQNETTTPSGSTASKRMPKPGSAILAKGIDYEFKNMDINAADTATDGRNIERMICKGTQLVEGVVTGDYSNQNYASALVAESPMVKAIEGWQDIVEEYLRVIFVMVIQSAKRNGLIGSASEECSVNFASMVHRELVQDTQAYQIHAQNGWASNKTVSSKLGYDYDEEQKQIKAEDEHAMANAKNQEEELNSKGNQNGTE